ncbi:MAG: hypothetical protein KDA65_19925, partial [Planctomycetaceae bacterium]|nr:hypothetical protein [Planctomycetaceae bacterium]
LMKGISLMSGNNEEFSPYLSKDSYRAFVTSSPDKEDFVIASWCFVYENTMDMFETNLPNLCDDNSRMVGELIAKAGYRFE